MAATAAEGEMVRAAVSTAVSAAVMQCCGGP